MGSAGRRPKAPSLVRMDAMPHVFEPASSGRSKCRGCDQFIQRGDLRFGERLPNPFGDGEITQWYHPLCAAYKRPEPVLQALRAAPQNVPDPGGLECAALGSLAHHRLPRIDGAERARSGQAKCRSCRQQIERGEWRIRLVFYEEGRFSPGGFVHFSCSQAYFETWDIGNQVLHFSSALSPEEREELKREIGKARDVPARGQAARMIG